MELPEMFAKHQIHVICPTCGMLVDGWTWDDMFECPLCGTKIDHMNFDMVTLHKIEEVEEDHNYA